MLIRVIGNRIRAAGPPRLGLPGARSQLNNRGPRWAAGPVPARHAFVPAGTLVRAPPRSPHPARGIAPTQVSSGLRRRQRPPSQTGRFVRPHALRHSPSRQGCPEGPMAQTASCLHGYARMRDLALPQPRPGAARHRIKSTPCGTRTRNLRIRGPTPCPLGQGGNHGSSKRL